MSIQTIDLGLIHFFRKVFMPFARVAFFVVFFWFGLLKVIGLSPAGILVANLFAETISFMDFNTFYLAFGIFECLIGVLFLIKGFERLAIPLLFFHMILTLGPLVMLPEMIWQSPMVPTMEGQYIIKNLVIIALAIGVAAHLHPMAVKNANINESANA